MLKFLTHKLRTHSLNEESASEKVEERDSGTESDDDAERSHDDFCTDVIMKWNNITDISMSGAAEAPRLLRPEPQPDPLYDHHSSEEELEVINGAPAGPGRESRRRAASSPPPAAPEKRKWPAAPYRRLAPDDDDDDTKVETPVRFRTSPPLEALKPRRAGGAGGLGIAGGTSAGRRSPRPSPCPPSPRRRRLPAPPPRRHRPALDFDKMQQLKVGGVSGVRAWRGAHAHGGELSVFCW